MYYKDIFSAMNNNNIVNNDIYNKKVGTLFIMFLTIITVSLFFSFCSSNDKEDKEGSDFSYFSKKTTSKCKNTVREFEGEIIKGFSGKLIVVGNEPFTRLVLRLDKDMEVKLPDDSKEDENNEGENDSDKNNDKVVSPLIEKTIEKGSVLRIAKDCSAELWDYQNIPIIIDGKLKESFLETVTGQKMRILTLYPINIKKREQ